MKPHLSHMLLSAALGMNLQGVLVDAQQVNNRESYALEAGIQLVDDRPTDGLEMGAYASTDLGDDEWQFMRRQLNKLPTRLKQKMLNTDLEHVNIF